MTSFETIADAKIFMRDQVDNPVSTRQEVVGESLSFTASSFEVGNGQFTNVYDVSYRARQATPAIHLYDQLTSVYDFAKDNNGRSVFMSGGFFFLADLCSGAPRHLALNLAITDGKVRSLPVVDREALYSDGNRLSAELLQAMGTLSINGEELSWSGSLTDHDTDSKIFGNGNSIIEHKYNEATGNVRVLDESSRFTPAIEADDTVDIGFIAREDGSYAAGASSTTGGVDIFAHDLVVRCHERYLAQSSEMKIHTIGSLAIDGMLQGALSVGPMLSTGDFAQHPINTDASLGDRPPFLEGPLARTVVYETEDNVVHLRLFDGRPGSDIFPGVTPSEVAQSVEKEGAIIWGCFLDPGQTAKLCVRVGDDIESFGNSHYLKWKTHANEQYLWVPKTGRPTASIITL